MWRPLSNGHAQWYYGTTSVCGCARAAELAGRTPTVRQPLGCAASRASHDQETYKYAAAVRSNA